MTGVASDLYFWASTFLTVLNVELIREGGGGLLQTACSMRTDQEGPCGGGCRLNIV